ncbi:MAG: hypothetical protein DRR19_08985 [Candidatus Parabeggiatoa sp. nov. 1]|nr:MAG: hypothetical protein DRR19_08985 [Gammaproteobacteria bacterium]
MITDEHKFYKFLVNAKINSLRQLLLITRAFFMNTEKRSTLTLELNKKPQTSHSQSTVPTRARQPAQTHIGIKEKTANNSTT